MRFATGAGEYAARAGEFTAGGAADDGRPLVLNNYDEVCADII